MRELFDALALFAELVMILPVRAQLALVLIVLVLGALVAGTVRLTAAAVRWCWRTARRRRPPAAPVAASPPPASVLDGLTLADPDDPDRRP